MNRGIYSAATAMESTQQWMDVVTNNLANASTTGYKRDGMAFEDAMTQQLEIGIRPIGSISAGMMPTKEYTDFEVGAPQPTHNPMDVAITSKQGLFAVQDANGQVSYTRDGAFSLDANRNLVTTEGYRVLDSGFQPISVGNGPVEIAADGTVTAGGFAAGKIGVFDGSFQKVGGNLFSAVGQPAAIDQPSLQPGALESSNVNAIESMVQMISLNRGFELAQKSIQSQDDSTEKLIQSLS